MPDDGGPAFPRPASEDRKYGDQPDGNYTVPDQNGMTLRDWFAGQALAGYLAMHAAESLSTPAPDDAAKAAYDYADAMLAERKIERKM